MSDFKERFARYHAWSAISAMCAHNGVDAPKCPEPIARADVRAEGDTVTVDFDGVIVGSTASEFRKQINAAMDAGPVANLVVRYNSIGGVVDAARGMTNDLRMIASRGVNIESVNMGVVASAAVLPFSVGKVRTMMDGSRLMIHQARSGMIVFGTSDDFRKASEDVRSAEKQLSGIDEDQVKTYSYAARMPKSKVMEMLRAETWMNEETAVKNRFATRGDPLDDADDEQDGGIDDSESASVAAALSDIYASSDSIFFGLTSAK